MDNFDDAPIPALCEEACCGDTKVAGASTHRPDKWAEENRREQALRLAIEAGRGVPACDLVHAAAMFEAYLRDGSLPVSSWAQQSAARADRIAKVNRPMINPGQKTVEQAQAYVEAIQRTKWSDREKADAMLGLNTSIAKD